MKSASCSIAHAVVTATLQTQSSFAEAHKRGADEAPVDSMRRSGGAAKSSSQHAAECRIELALINGIDLSMA